MKQFDPWDVNVLLSLLGSWSSTSSLTNFKIVRTTATLLAIFKAKYCCDLTLLCIDNQHLILQHHAAIFVLASGGNLD